MSDNDYNIMQDSSGRAITGFIFRGEDPRYIADFEEQNAGNIEQLVEAGHTEVEAGRASYLYDLPQKAAADEEPQETAVKTSGAGTSTKKKRKKS